MKDCLRKIGLSGQHLLSLINDVLDMSKIESGEMVLREDSMSLPEVLENVVAIMQPQFGEKEQHFSIRLRSVVHEQFLSDALRMRQIFINILSNAYKFTPVNGTVSMDVCEKQAVEDVYKRQGETLWNCDQIRMDQVSAKGDYFAMNSSNLYIDGFELVGNYSFDGVKNAEIHHARLLSKDAFWNSENVTVYDSFISGEYLGWNAKNLTLINCTIESSQGMCYICLLYTSFPRINSFFPISFSKSMSCLDSVGCVIWRDSAAPDMLSSLVTAIKLSLIHICQNSRPWIWRT